MSLVNLEKRSGFFKKAVPKANSLERTVIGALGLAAGIEGIDSAKNALSKQLDKAKVRNAVAYAKQKHPELRRRSEKDLAAWTQGIYAISPRVATSPALAASALLTVDAYNGNFDLATAKILSDINRGISSSDDKSHFMGALSTAHNIG